MVNDFSKLLSHPLKDEIITKLVSGIKPKDVADWLKLRFSGKDEAHLRLSSVFLKTFLDSNLDLHETMKTDIEAAKSNGKLDRQLAASLKNNKTYQERISEIADTEFDIKKMMVEVGTLIRARIEQYFDKMQENPGNLKPDYGLIKWFEVLLNYTEKYDKIVNNAPDKVVQHNVTVQVIDQYVSVLQECIRATLAEIDVDAASLFLEKFTENVGKLQVPEGLKSSPMPQEKRMLEAKVLSSATLLEEDAEFPTVEENLDE
jgi:hypothetical protein